MTRFKNQLKYRIKYARVLIGTKINVFSTKDKDMPPLLQQKIRQFLLHSFLYYQMDESIISDKHYDALCLELMELLQQHPQSEKDPLRELVESSLDHESSGFSIRNYPPTIISAAIHCLYQSKYATLMSFPEFLQRSGYVVAKTA